MPEKIHLLVRALILKDNQILLAKGVGSKFTFLPGGHIEVGESAKKSLKRELQEEMGAEVKVGKYLGVLEHSFSLANRFQHEINHIFLVELVNNEQKIKSKENHLHFFWVNIDELEKNNLEPSPLKKIIPEVLKNKNFFFWQSTINNN